MSTCKVSSRGQGVLGGGQKGGGGLLDTLQEQANSVDLPFPHVEHPKLAWAWLFLPRGKLTWLV